MLRPDHRRGPCPGECRFASPRHARLRDPPGAFWQVGQKKVRAGPIARCGRSSRRILASGRARLRGRRHGTHAGNSRASHRHGRSRATSIRRTQAPRSARRGYARRVRPPSARRAAPPAAPDAVACGAAPRRHRCCQAPAISLWSRSAAFNGAALAVNSDRIAAPDKALPSGSIPSPSRWGEASPGSVHGHEAEAPGVIVDDPRAVERWKMT